MRNVWPTNWPGMATISTRRSSPLTNNGSPSAVASWTTPAISAPISKARDKKRDPQRIIRDYGAPHLLHDVPLPPGP